MSIISTINTGLTSFKRDLSVTSNNLANLNTVGFKKSTVSFADIFANDPTSNAKTAVGSGVINASVDKVMSQGAMASTARITDLAIAGQGFFTLGATGNAPKFPAVSIPTFTGVGLTPATWPATMVNPPYPQLPSVTGVGLPSATWMEPPSVTLVGVNLPKAEMLLPKAHLIDINYTETSFTNGDFSEGPSITTGNVVSVPGWKIYNEQVLLGQNGTPGSSLIGGFPTPIDPSPNPIGSSGGISRGDDYTVEGASFTGNFVGQVAALPSAVTTNQGYDIVHGPYLVSDSSVAIKQGATVSFKYRVEAGGDAPDVYAYLLNIDTGDTIQLLDETGLPNISTPDEIKSNTIDVAGDYKFVFVSGSFDWSGGRVAGASLIIDDVSISNNTDPDGDSYEILVDGISRGTGTRSDAPKSVDLSNYVNDYGSVIEVKFSNSKDAWPWSYKLKEDNIVVKENDWKGSVNTVETDSYNTEPEGPGITPDPAISWSEGVLSGTCKNVFHCDEGAGIGSLGGFSGRDPYISFGNGGSIGERFLGFDNIDFSSKNKISFDVINGTNFNGGEDHDGGESLNLEYSIDGGQTFKLLASLTSGSLIQEWTEKSFSIPSEAQISNAYVRFYQSNSSGSHFDQWGLANISFERTEPATVTNDITQSVPWSEGVQSGSAKNVSVTAADGSGTGSNGAFSGEVPYITFGSGGVAGPRYFLVDNLDLSHTSSVNFKLKCGDDLNGGEKPDAPLEDLKVLFSVDGGTTFSMLGTFSSAEIATNEWQSKSLSFPTGAKATDVCLKFQQDGSSGADYDHWALSNISFVPDATPPYPEPATVKTQTGASYQWVLDGKDTVAQNVFVSDQSLGIGSNMPFSGKQPYISFGGGGVAGQRSLTYPPLDLRSKVSLQFDIIAGNNSNGGDKSDTGELMFVEYSTDGGKTFSYLKSFDNAKGSISEWSTQTISLPIDAKAENVQLRFRQAGSSGPQYDHWGLTNIAFVDPSEASKVADTRVYTRAGNFAVDKEGYLTASSGLRVLGTNVLTQNELEAVQIPLSYKGSLLAGINVNSGGRVTATYSDGASLPLYDLAIASFANEGSLKSIGNTHMTATRESGDVRYFTSAQSGRTIMSATLERANTDVTSELMGMLSTQQKYNANARMLQAYIESASLFTDKL